MKSAYQKIKLGDIVQFCYGKSLTEETRKIGEVPVYGSSGIVDYNDKFLVKGPGLIVGRKGNVGSVYFEKNNFFPIDTVYFLKKTNEVDDLRYLYYLLKYLPLNKLNSDAAVPGLNRETALKVKTFLPNPITQRKISNILLSYDDLIDTNRRRIQLLEESARLLFREWFVYFRFPGHEKVKIVDGVPEGWKKGLLGDMTIVKKGRNITFENAVEGNVSVVGGGLKPSYYHNKANVSAPVITISASGANAGYVNIYETDIWASDCSYINKDSTKYIYSLYLRLKSLQSAISSFQVGAAQPHVYLRDLNRLKLLIAPDNLCMQFEQLVIPIFNLIKNLKSENQKLAQARDLLLPRLMSGAIEV